MMSPDISEYSHLTKNEKSKYNALKEAIFAVSQKLGEGKSNPVPYDTAWVARVPTANDLTVPAFPLSLQWLRDNQLDDGSWGEDYPRAPHSKTLNTFVAVVTLAQWNYPEDNERKERGIKALWALNENLPQTKTKNYWFEMIMSSLIDDASEYKIQIPYEYYAWCSETGKSTLEKLKPNLISNRPNKIWFYLEAAGRTVELEPEYYRSTISRNGLIAAQPSTTAFILRYARLRGENYPEAEWALAKFYNENSGGIPHWSSCDNFEIIYGLDFLFKAGINSEVNVKHKCTKNAVDLLSERWSSSKDGIGFSSRCPFPDAGCTEGALSVLQQSYRVEQELNFISESNKSIEQSKGSPLEPSFRVNLSSLTVLKSAAKTQLRCPLFFPSDTVQNEWSWLENETPLTNGSNVSVYYHAMCKIFSPYYSKIKMISQIINFVAKSQNRDGGWGGKGTSTLEETAYVSLALFHLIRQNYQLPSNINFIQLSKFLNSDRKISKNEALWISKVIFCPTVVSEAAIVAAKFAVFQILRLCIMRDALNENQLNYSIINILDSHENPVYSGCSIYYRPKVLRSDIATDEQELIDIIKKEVLSSESPYLNPKIELSMEVSYFLHSVKDSPHDRVIHIIISMIYVLVDNIIDIYLLENSINFDRVKEMFDVIFGILRGQYANLEALPAFQFPDFIFLAKCFFYTRKVFNKRGWSIESYIKSMDPVIWKGFIQEYKDQYYNVEPTAKRYLQTNKTNSTVSILCHQGCLLRGDVDPTKFEDYDLYLKFKDSASKAARIYNDILSVPKDEENPYLDNYVLRLKYEYKVSIQEAMLMAAKKVNREIIKMYLFKKIMQQDLKYKDNKDLFVCINEMENFIDGMVDLTLDSVRYKSEWNITRENVTHEQVDLGFVWNLCFY